MPRSREGRAPPRVSEPIPHAVRTVIDRLVNGPSGCLHLITVNVAMETLRKRCNRPSDALAVFHKVQATGYLNPDAFTYTSALAALNALGTATVDKDVTQEPRDFMKEATDIFEGMKRSGVDGNVYTHTAMISICANQGRMDAALDIYAEMHASGQHVNAFTYSVLIPALLKNGRRAEARAMFGDLKVCSTPFSNHCARNSYYGRSSFRRLELFRVRSHAMQ